MVGVVVPCFGVLCFGTVARGVPAVTAPVGAAFAGGGAARIVGGVAGGAVKGGVVSGGAVRAVDLQGGVGPGVGAVDGCGRVGTCGACGVRECLAECSVPGCFGATASRPGLGGVTASGPRLPGLVVWGLGGRACRESRGASPGDAGLCAGWRLADAEGRSVVGLLMGARLVRSLSGVRCPSLLPLLSGTGPESPADTTLRRRLTTGSRFSAAVARRGGSGDAGRGEVSSSFEGVGVPEPAVFAGARVFAAARALEAARGCEMAGVFEPDGAVETAGARCAPADVAFAGVFTDAGSFRRGRGVGVGVWLAARVAWAAPGACSELGVRAAAPLGGGPGCGPRATTARCADGPIGSAEPAGLGAGSGAGSSIVRARHSLTAAG